ncbi:MAG TPA: RNA polymerase sigma factor [Polyangiaceae bacterium]
MSGDPETRATRKAIEAVWRIESARLIGGLVRVVRDLELAEDLAQEALVVALERWPTTGIPDNPGAWLMTTAKNRAIDHLRRTDMTARKHEVVERDAELVRAPDIETALDEDVGDDLLRLILVACHPVLSTEARTALTLRLLGGLTTDEIARAFLVPEPTIAQRIVRAKRTLSEARVPFEVPRGDELAARLPSVFDVVYLIFNEGYAATRGDDWMRVELCEDALRLGRILAALVPDVAEAHGLVALMELHASRFRARVDAKGAPIPLTEQNRARWDHLLIQRGLAAMARAEALAQPLGPFTLQAAIVACHARARIAEETDWKKIVALYDALVEVTHSPVVALNRAVAVGMAFGPEAGLECVDDLAGEPSLRNYYLLPGARGDVLEKLGRHDEARAEFERAASMTENQRERAFLLSRARACREGLH